MDQVEPQDLGLVFEWANDGRTLLATFTPPEIRQPIDTERLRAILAEQGFGALFLFENALTELAQKLVTATEPYNLAVAERRDATAHATVTADKMTAYLTVTPPFGGKPVDRQMVQEALDASGITSGIKEEEIGAAIAAGHAEHKTIAEGRPPIPGTDTKFENLCPEIRERRPQVDEHGIANYRELGQFVTVKPGDPLMRRIPATPGVPGENVMGVAIPTKPGKDQSFAPGLKGAAIDPNDGNLLVATISGQPVQTTNGVMVEPTLSVQNVDLSTGNLTFEGSINIAADIKAGMKIKASGDIIVAGTVEAAEVDAGGDVVVKGGIIGQAEIRDHGAAHPSPARVHSGGSVSARFIENASVQAGNCIMVDEAVTQSEVTAINQVVVGKKNARKGHIIGGTTRATLLVEALVVGSPAGIATRIEVGVNPLLQGKLNAINEQLHHLEKQKEELDRVIAFAKDHPQRINPEMLQKAQRTDEKVQLDMTELNQEKGTLQAQVNLAEGAKVTVGQKIYGGTEVWIGSKVRHMEEERSGGTFKLDEETGEIVFS